MEIFAFSYLHTSGTVPENGRHGLKNKKGEKKENDGSHGFSIFGMQIENFPVGISCETDKVFLGWDFMRDRR